MTAQIASEFAGQLDFVLLPGDNADNGLIEQYRLIAPVLKMPDVSVYSLTGDHDMEQGSLANFYTILKVNELPFNNTEIQCVTMLLKLTNLLGSLFFFLSLVKGIYENSEHHIFFGSD